MANVDLQGGDAQRIRDQYRQSLGRDASDDEVSGWLSGQFGGGSVDDRIRQISGSNEAQQYRPPVVGQNPNVSVPQTPTSPDGYGPGGVDADYFNALASDYQK